MRESCRKRHADRHRLAVQIALVVGQRSRWRDRSCGRSSESRDSPLSRSSRRTTIALRAQRLAHDSAQQRHVERQDRRRAAARCSANSSGSRMTPYLITSARPARNSRRGRVFKRVDVDHDQARLVEGADEVLAGRMVDAGLAADAGVDLRQQRGRHLHERHAAHEGRGGEAGQVADDAAAEGDHAASDARGRRRPAGRR